VRGRRKLIVVLLLFSLVLLSSSCVKLLNHAPVIRKPPPANNATDVPINTTLTWEAEDEDGDALTFDVYFGTSSNPPLVKSGINERKYTLETLEYGTTYYWKVVAKDGKGGTAESPVWKFTTTRLKWKFKALYVCSSPAIGQDGTFMPDLMMAISMQFLQIQEALPIPHGPCSTMTRTTLAAMVTTDGNNTALPRLRSFY